MRFSRNDRTVEVIKLFILWYQQQFPFALPVIGPWALRENNALQFSPITPFAVHLEKNAIICTKSQTIMRTYVHLRQSAFNCAKCTLYKDVCIIVNIQLSFKTFINVLRHSNSLKQLSFARIVNTITLKEYSSA